MRRREFISLLGGAPWSLTAYAEQSDRTRKVGILMPLGENDLESPRRIGTFSQTLRQIGWIEGHTIAFEKRFAEGDPKRLPALAAELVHANCDVIVT